MSGWGLGWFGGGQAKKEVPKKAILQLRGQLEMLNKREKHLQNQMDEQDSIARKYVSSNKNGKLVFAISNGGSADHAAAAKAALRRKKQFEHSLEQTSSQIMTLEREIYSIENANINKETLDAMKNAGSAMKQIHAGLTIDKVDNVMYAIFSLDALDIMLYQSLTHSKGRSPRTARNWRRNQRSHQLGRHSHRHRRRRTRRGTRRTTTGEARRGNAQDRQCPCQRHSGGRIAACCAES